MDLNLIPRPKSVILGQGIAPEHIVKAIDPAIPMRVMPSRSAAAIRP